MKRTGESFVDKDWKFQALETSERDHPFDQRYLCLCFVCGKGYAGPKRSVMCNMCSNSKKPVDKE